MSLPILQFLQIKKFALLDKARKINNVVYNLQKMVFQYTAISNSGKIAKFPVRLNITYIVISFVFHD